MQLTFVEEDQLPESIRREGTIDYVDLAEQLKVYPYLWAKFYTGKLGARVQTARRTLGPDFAVRERTHSINGRVSDLWASYQPQNAE